MQCQQVVYSLVHFEESHLTDNMAFAHIAIRLQITSTMLGLYTKKDTFGVKLDAKHVL